jgi:2-oxoisovalerate ferredoxin oxidoreductase beta subunit
VEIGRLAVETGAWALFEYELGQLSFNLMSKSILERKSEPKPIEEYLKLQGRFNGLFKPERNDEALATIQRGIDADWERFRKQVECGIA